eukprot:1840414-Alexandrium_andersonii.AAC.1
MPKGRARAQTAYASGGPSRTTSSSATPRTLIEGTWRQPWPTSPAPGRPRLRGFLCWGAPRFLGRPQ